MLQGRSGSASRLGGGGERRRKTETGKILSNSFPSPAFIILPSEKGKVKVTLSSGGCRLGLLCSHLWAGYLQRKRFLGAPWARLSLRAVLLSATGGRLSSSSAGFSLQPAQSSLPATCGSGGLCIQRLRPENPAATAGGPGRRGYRQAPLLTLHLF